jgi:hypothetical protein
MAPKRDEASLEGSGPTVVARVEDRGVGLAGARSDVGPRLDQRDAQLEAGELAGNRRPDVAGPGDGDVVDG